MQEYTAPVRGSMTTTAPLKPLSACSAAVWIRESMVRSWRCCRLGLARERRDGVFSWVIAEPVSVSFT